MLQIFDETQMMVLCLYPFPIDRIPLPRYSIDIVSEGKPVFSLEVHAIFQNEMLCNEDIVSAVITEIQDTEVYFGYIKMYNAQIKKDPGY
jgi:hypothetical protein